jgi:hypothetical protein
VIAVELQPLPFRSPLSAYEQQAETLLAGHRAGDSAAIDLFHRRHPRFLDDKITWRPKFIPDSDIREAALSLDDARLVIARYDSFLDWSSLVAHVEAISHDGPVFAFESAVEAVEGLLIRRGPLVVDSSCASEPVSTAQRISAAVARR